jgi:hypothetical protein
MAEDPTAAGPGEEPSDDRAEEPVEATSIEPAEEPAEAASVEPVEEAGAVAAQSPRGTRLLRWGGLLCVGAVAFMEISSPLCSGYSLGALEQAFDGRPKSGLTLTAAQGHLVGMATMSFREEPNRSKSSRSVHFAVFEWPTLFFFIRRHKFEVEIERVADKNVEEGVILVRSQPYVPVESNYKVVQPYAKPDPPLMQLMMLDHEPDSKGTYRVERWQVERAIKNKKAEPSLLVYFDKNDKNKDGVVTAGEMGQQKGIGNTGGGGKSKKAAGGR